MQNNKKPYDKIKQSLFADDATYFLNDNSDSFNNLIESLTLYGTASGLKLNISKCTVLRYRPVSDNWYDDDDRISRFLFFSSAAKGSMSTPFVITCCMMLLISRIHCQDACADLDTQACVRMNASQLDLCGTALADSVCPAYCGKCRIPLK
ncbi:hypothetical protein DPMN_017455 [Dreissena polymorpha]|uniref:Reverse transcriptase domain-containing protein n=1 Tax=Dreissena polymorpha TaxID=45954 RepID=A0A9D4S7G3_DREPO|nr:hypothetical protein DPMN_017455 [Dreissena polymorpha]